MPLTDQLAQQAGNLFAMFVRLIILIGQFFIQIFDVAIGFSWHMEIKATGGKEINETIRTTKKKNKRQVPATGNIPCG